MLKSSGYFRLEHKRSRELERKTNPFSMPTGTHVDRISASLASEPSSPSGSRAPELPLCATRVLETRRIRNKALYIMILLRHTERGSCQPRQSRSMSPSSHHKFRIHRILFVEASRGTSINWHFAAKLPTEKIQTEEQHSTLKIREFHPNSYS